MESLVGKLVKVSKDIVFLEDRHVGSCGSYGFIVSIIDNEEKYASFKKHPELLKHLVRDGEESFYDRDVMFDIMTDGGEKIRLFYSEFTILE